MLLYSHDISLADCFLLYTVYWCITVLIRFDPGMLAHNTKIKVPLSTSLFVVQKLYVSIKINLNIYTHIIYTRINLRLIYLFCSYVIRNLTSTTFSKKVLPTAHSVFVYTITLRLLGPNRIVVFQWILKLNFNQSYTCKYALVLTELWWVLVAEKKKKSLSHT